MPLNLAANCPQSARLLASAAGDRAKAGWWEMFLPILLELFQELIEQCMDNQAEFVKRAKRLHWWNVWRLKIVCRRALRQADVGSARTRDGQAELLAGDIAMECSAATAAELAACYDELTG